MDLVKEFMTVGSQKYFIFNEVNQSLTSLRGDLIIEEMNELFESLNNNDLIETVDALADISYVTYGYLLILMSEDEYNDYIKNTDPYYNSIKYYSNGDDDDNGDNLKKNNVNLKYYLSYLNDDYNQFKELNNSFHKQLYNKNIFKKDLITLLEKIIFKTYLLSNIINIDLNKAFLIVHLSNMSKFDTNLNDANKTMEKYKAEGKDTYYDILNINNIDYYITKALNGKILKSINYIPPDLSYLNNI